MKQLINEAFNIQSLKDIGGILLAISTTLFGIDKWKRYQEKNKAKAGEITNKGLKIENKSKELDIETKKIQSLIITIEQLKKDNENFGIRINKLQIELQEVYAKLDELRDENLKLENELYKCKKNKIGA